jgi:4-hydroxybenzoate polyprenyltransferase
VALRDWLRLARVPLAPTAAFDSVACALLARAPGFSRGPAPEAPTVLALAALAATSVLLYCAGMAGNDLADRRRDATIAPDRPIPAGRVSATGALAFVLACAALALALGGGPEGDRRAVALALVFAAAYDGVLKRSATLGAAAMGLVRACNAAVGVLPLVLLERASPLALLAPATIGLYSAGITLLSTTEERPRRAIAFGARLLALVAFAAAGVLSTVGARGGTLGTVLAASVVLSIATGRVPRPGPPKRRVLEMLLGIYLLDAVLASGAREGDAVFGLAAVAAAFLFVYLSQVAIRALRPRA